MAQAIMPLWSPEGRARNFSAQKKLPRRPLRMIRDVKQRRLLLAA